jgi:hypothetical protein
MQPNIVPRIVIVAGQSNMVGYRTLSKDLAPRWQKAQPDCFYWQASEWIPLQANKLNQKSAFGPELTLAQRLAGTGGGPVGIIKVARNGSYLERHWSPSKKNGLFAQLVSQTQAALQKQPSRLCGMVWLQGEADGLNEEDAKLYHKRYIHFIQQVRISLSAPTLPIVAGVVNPPKDRFLYRNKVRRSLKRASLKNYTTVRMDDLELQNDGLHLSAKGLSIIGKRFANSLANFPLPKNITHWIWSTDNYQCWYSGPEKIPEHVIVSLPFAVVDSGYNEFGFGQSAFDKRDVGVIYIRSNKSNWFQHDEVMELAISIRRYVGEHTDLTLYGASMGAYAALLLSGLLKPKRIFAIAPQFSIDRTIVPWETRWSKSANRIKKFKFNLNEHIDDSSKKLIFFDNMSMDKSHVSLLPVDKNWSLIRLPYASHQVLRYLRETGCLPLLVDCLIDQTSDVSEIELQARLNKKVSSIYWMTIAKCGAPNRPKFSENAFREAISCGGPKHKILKHIEKLKRRGGL